MASIEEKVEEQYKKILGSLGIRHYGKTETINPNITNALKSADSKSGGTGNNYPDIKVLVNNKIGRYIPVMIEAKGSKGKLEKLAKDGSIVGITYYDKDGKLNKDGVPVHLKGEPNYSAIKNFAVNGAVQIALLCLLSLFSTTVYAAELNVNGTSIPISNSNYVGYFLDDTTVYRAQSIVDSHQVAVSNSPLDVNDGNSTHLMAHNPGLFSVIADSIYNGAIYTVTDDNGNKQAYQFYYVGEVEAYTYIEPGHPIYEAVCLAGEEAISLQYCANGTVIPQIWLGRPVAMPVEEPVEVAEEPVEVVEEPVDVVEEPVEVVEEPVEDVEEPVEEVQEPVTEKVKDVKEKDKTPSSSNGAKEKDKTSSSNNVAVKSRKRNMKSNMNNFKKLAFMLPVLFVVGCTAKTKIKPTVEQSTVDSSAIVDGVEAIDESDISNALTEDPSVNIENNIKSAIPKIYTAKHVLTVPETTEVTVEKSDNGYVAHLSVDGVEIGVINVVDNVYDFVELDTFSTYATVESRSE